MYDQLKIILYCLYPSLIALTPTKGTKMAKDEFGRMERWPSKEMTDDQLIEIIEGHFSEPCIIQASRMLLCRVARFQKNIDIHYHNKDGSLAIP